MKATECEGIPLQDQEFLDYLAGCFKNYKDRKVAKKFGVAYSKAGLAGLEPGDLMRYRRSPAGKGFTVQVGPKATIVATATAGDPCCEWVWDDDAEGWICIGWC